jgi:hypothetical protein
MKKLMSNEKEILLVVSIFEKGTKEENNKHTKRVIGFPESMATSESIRNVAHGTVDIALNEFNNKGVKVDGDVK